MDPLTQEECMTTCPQCLAGVVTQILDGLLWKRIQNKAKSYEKIDLKIKEQGLFFKIDITKCSSQYPDLKLLLTISIKAELISKARDENVVAKLVKKLKTGYQASKVVYSTKTSSFSLVPYDADEPTNEFSPLKQYVTIKLLFQVENNHFEEFFSLIMKSIKQIEKIDPNIKFTIRRGDDCVYKNYVQMDDSEVCCKIVSGACTSVFKNSQDSNFRENLKERLNIKNEVDFEETFNRLLLGLVNKNFDGSIK